MTHYASSPDAEMALGMAWNLAHKGHEVSVRRVDGVWEVHTADLVLGAQCIECGCVTEPASSPYQCEECKGFSLHVWAVGSAVKVEV
jgi:hypothetical protein